MNSKLDQTLRDVAEEVFESLAFVLLMPDQDGPPSSDNIGKAVASITFSGPFGGALFLSISEQMLPMIAANMLGLDFDETPTDVQQQDAFKELLNVICGNLLPRIAGTEAVFDVQKPMIVPDGQVPQTHQQQPPVATAQLNLEDGAAELACFGPDGLPAEVTGVSQVSTGQTASEG